MAAFVIFETQEGYERACEIKPRLNWKNEVTSDKTFLDQPLFFKEAPEPTNIVWENRNVSYKTQFFRKIMVLLIIVLILVMAFVIFYTLKSFTAINNMKYPLSNDCESISNLFK